MRELGERGDIIKTMHRALADHGLADERAPAQYVAHGKQITEPIVGRVLSKGLAGDEMGNRLHLVIDGVDGRAHYVETADSLTWPGSGAATSSRSIRRRPRPNNRRPAACQHPRSWRERQWRHLPAEPASRKRRGTSSSSATATPTPSSAPMCAGWKPCAAPGMSSASTPTIGEILERHPRRGVSPMTPPAGPRISASARCPRSTSTGRLAATGRPGSTVSWLRKTICPLRGTGFWSG